MIDIKKHFWLVLPLLLISAFFLYFTVQQGIPLPADSLVGLYHPWRDALKKQFPSGYPYKNYLITDPVRQQYPWKKLAVEQIKQGRLPLWNRFSFSGYPLSANFQSGAFYIANLLMVLFQFNTGWTIYITIQPILALIFMYFFLKDKTDNFSAALGGVSFAFSGFIVAWFEWGTLGHTLIWLPLIFHLIEKNIINNKPVNKLLLVFALCSSFFAGHLQTAFYVVFISALYTVSRLLRLKIDKKDKKKAGKRIGFLYLLFILLTSIQWLPTIKLINASTRGMDVPELLFIPLKQLVQFFFPDFFGNPATMNYWGEWNYLEYVSYIGIIPAFFALYYLFTTKFKNKSFFKLTMLFSFVLASANPIARIPFVLEIPFLSTASPARLIALICFSGAVLAGFGADKFFNQEKKKVLYPLVFLIFLSLFWAFVFSAVKFNLGEAINLAVAKRNLIFPTAVFASFFVGLLLKQILDKLQFTKKLTTSLNFLFLSGVLLLALGDGLRFTKKFNPFVPRELIYPQTKIIKLLENDREEFRVMALDDRIMPANASIFYHLPTIQGYDPLMVKDYVSLVHYSETGEYTDEYNLNRFLNPKNIETGLIDLLNVKYVLSFKDLDESFEKVMEEGRTKLYKNPEYLPRAFFADELRYVGTEKELYKKIIDQEATTKNRVVYQIGDGDVNSCQGEVLQTEVEGNRVKVTTENENDCYLVVSQVYYPSWQVEVDGRKQKLERINAILLGVELDQGKHEVIFKKSLL